jgi:hypothetical protein
MLYRSHYIDYHCAACESTKFTRHMKIEKKKKDKMVNLPLQAWVQRGLCWNCSSLTVQA